MSYLFELSEGSNVIYLLLFKLCVSNKRIKNWQANLNLFLVFFTPCQKRLSIFTHVTASHVNFLEQKNVSPKEKSSPPKRMTWNTMLYKQRFRKRIYFVAIITVVSVTKIGVLKPGFHIIVQVVSIARLLSKCVQTIQTIL